MTDNTENKPGKNFTSSLVNLLILAVAIYYIVKMPMILLVIIGFGAVVMIHELGHFLAAKAVGIKVDEFAIGMGAILTGLRRTEKGLRIRIMPSIICDKDLEPKLVYDLPILAGKEGETEYQLRLLPLGGFVKMLGQEDLGPDIASDDPRSFGNKAIWKRAIVISAGVIMNLISGALAFILVFANGVELPPAIIGMAMPDSPAAKAGLVAGDKVLEINGKSNAMMSFMDLKLASAFSRNGETVTFKVQRKDGSQKDFVIEPTMDKKLGLRMLGIEQPVTMKIAKIKEEKVLKELEKFGLVAGDIITKSNGQPITYYGEFLERFLQPADGVAPSEQLITVQKTDNSTKELLIKPEFIMSSIYGMYPRIEIGEVTEKSPAELAGLKAGDIIIRVGDQAWPTSEELPEICNSNSGKKVAFTVLRKNENGIEEELTLDVTPVRSFSLLSLLKGKLPPARIGVAMKESKSSNIISIAKAWSEDAIADHANTSLAQLPRGSKITAINGVAVANFEDILLEMQKGKNSDVTVSYVAPGSDPYQDITVFVPDNKDWYKAAWYPDYDKLIDLPLENFQTNFKADNMAQSIEMGMAATKSFLAQTYMTISGMLSGSVNMKAASGPIGILKMSYTVASERPIEYYVYMMAMLSVCIAVFNFLPLPILDGGLMVLLLLEKIMGKPLSTKAQEIINWIGLALILTLFISVTYNDLITVLGG